MQVFRKPKNFFSLKFSNIGITGRVVFLFIVPFIFAWLIFDPLIKVEFESNKNEPQYISKKEIDENLTRLVFFEFFQTSLNLGWYKICAENRGVLSTYGKIIVNEEEAKKVPKYIKTKVIVNREDVDDDAGDVTIRVKKASALLLNDSYQEFKIRPFGSPNCLRFIGNNEGLVVGSSTASLGRVGSHVLDEKMIGPEEFETNFSFDFTKINLYIKQDFLAFVIKYAIILLSWGSLILLVLNLYRWVTKL